MVVVVLLVRGEKQSTTSTIEKGRRPRQRTPRRPADQFPLTHPSPTRRYVSAHADTFSIPLNAERKEEHEYDNEHASADTLPRLLKTD